MKSVRIIGCVFVSLCSVALALNMPNYPGANSIDLDFETAYIHPSGGYYYLNEDGYDHLASYQGSGCVPDITDYKSYFGDKSMICSVNSASQGECARSELILLRTQTLGTTFYSSFAKYLPSNSAPTPAHNIFWQCWQWSGGSPPLAFNMTKDGNNYVFQRVVDAERGREILLQEKLPGKGDWHRYFVGYKLGIDNEGYVEVYVDGEKKLIFEGTTAASGDGIPTHSFNTKCGVYRYSDPSAFSTYFDGVRIGTSRGQVWYGNEATYPQTEPAVIGHWALDEPENYRIALDSSEGCRYVGELRGGVVRADGFIGGAVSLDGVDGYISIPESPIWDTGSAITVECRFKTDVNQSGKGLVMRDRANYKYMLYLSSSSGGISFYVRTSSGITMASKNRPTGYYADDLWHHIVGVYDRYAADGKRLKLYINGVLEAYATGYDEDILDGNEGIHIGRWGNNYFEGAIDDVKIYNYPVGHKTVQTSYARNAIGHWKFNDNSVTTEDSSIYNNPLVLFGGASFVEGSIGNAVAFDGVGGYAASYDGVGSIYDTRTQVTVSCRFKTTENQSGKSLIKYDGGSYKYMLYLSSNSGSISFYVRTSSGVSAAHKSVSAGYYADDLWHHIVGVYDRYAADGKRLKLYIDGVLAAHAAGYDEDILSGSGGIQVGRLGNAYFEGSIDEVSIYRDAFSEEEIGYIYSGVICDYDFDENSSVIASDGFFSNNYDAILNNGTEWVQGYSGAAVSFDGVDGYVSVPESPVWDTGSAITVECRFKTNVNQSGRGLVMRDRANYKYMLYLTSGSGSIQFYVRTASGVSIASKVQSTGYYADNQWHHVVGVYDRYATDGERLKIYVDGVFGGYATGYDEDILDGDEGIHIGRWGNNYFEGAIDDVKIYNCALVD